MAHARVMGMSSKWIHGTSVSSSDPVNIEHTHGKLPEAAIKAADDWLKRASKKDRRALRAISKGSGAG